MRPASGGDLDERWDEDLEDEGAYYRARGYSRRDFLPEDGQENPLELAYARALRQLDPDQRATVELSFDRVASISANAGSGKTTAMVARLLRYAAEGNDPASVVALSFTKVAASELKRRYAGLTGDDLLKPTRRSRPRIGTGHSFGMWLLGHSFGLTRSPLSGSETRRLLRDLPTFQAVKPAFSEVDDAIGQLCGRAEMHLLVWPEFDGAGRLVRVHDVVSAAMSRTSELRSRPGFAEQYATASWFAASAVQRRLQGKQAFPTQELRALALEGFAQAAGMEQDDAQRLLVEYVNAKYRSDVLDFADMLYQPFLLMVQHPHIRARVRRQFRMFVADEAQDMSALDLALLAMAAGFPDFSRKWPEGRSLMLVGDSKQSLYWWRDGMPLVMDSLDRYLETDPVSFGTLRYNYRSAAGIVAVSGDYARTFNRRHLFESIPVLPDTPNPIEIHRFATTAQEDKALVARLRALHAEGAPWSDFVVLSRMNRELDELQATLIAAGIPFKMRSDRKLSNTEAFGWVNAALGLALNPRNVIAVSTLALGLHGVGEKSVAKMEHVLRERLQDDPDLTVERALPLVGERAAAPLLRLLQALLPDLRDAIGAGGLQAGLEALQLALVSSCSWVGLEVPECAALRMTLEWVRIARVIALVSDVASALSGDLEFVELPGVRQLQELCASLNLAEEAEDAPGAAEGLTLTTIHGIKGGEGKYVFGVRLTRRKRVMEQDKDGERCAFYVLVTRAVQLLYLSSAEKIMDEQRWRFGVLNTNLSDFTTRWDVWKRFRAPTVAA